MAPAAPTTYGGAAGSKGMYYAGIIQDYMGMIQQVKDYTIGIIQESCRNYIGYI